MSLLLAYRASNFAIPPRGQKSIWMAGRQVINAASSWIGFCLDLNCRSMQQCCCTIVAGASEEKIRENWVREGENKKMLYRLQTHPAYPRAYIRSLIEIISVCERRSRGTATIEERMFYVCKVNRVNVAFFFKLKYTSKYSQVLAVSVCDGQTFSQWELGSSTWWDNCAFHWG